MKVFFFDDRYIESVENVEPVLEHPVKDKQNPLFGEDKPWEVRFDNLYPNVAFDSLSGSYKCWYNPFVVDPATTETPLKEREHLSYTAGLHKARERYGPNERETALCYAESDDGVNWKKPELGYSSNKSWKKTNLLMRHVHGNGVFLDEQEDDPAKKYKMVRYSEEDKHFYVHFSSNGIEWENGIRCPSVEQSVDCGRGITWSGDTHNNAFWAPSLKKYVLITRMWDKKNRIRLVGRSESPDFISWSESRCILSGLNERCQIYSMPVFYAEGLYFGLPALYERDSDYVRTGLAWSPDTISWKFINGGESFIENGPPGSIDHGCIYAAAVPIIQNKKTIFYYGGNDNGHYDWRKGYLCRCESGYGRFVGYKPSDPKKPGIIKTRFLEQPVIKIDIDAKTAAAADPAYELLDRRGKTIADDADALKKGCSVLIRFSNMTVYSMDLVSK